MVPIQRLSHTIRTCTQVGIYLILVFGFALFLAALLSAFLPGLAALLRLERHPASLANLGPGLRALAAGLAMAHTLALLAWLHPFHQLFRAFETGEIFTARTVQCFQRIGWGVLAYATYAFVGEGLLHPWLLANLQPGSSFSFRLETFPIGYLLVGCALLVVAHVMDEGRKLQAEQELVI